MRTVELSELLRKPAIENLLLVDTRNTEDFCEGFIKGSVSIPFGDNFLPTLQDLSEESHRIVFVSEPEAIPAMQQLLKGAALANIEGFLNGGFAAWKAQGHKFDMIICIDADEFAMDYQFDEFYLVDTRPKEDFRKEHVEDAENVPLEDYVEIMDELDTEASYYIYGAAASDAVTAASVFKRFGLERVRIIMANYESLKSTSVPFYTAKKKPGGNPQAGAVPTSEN